ncbi:MAG: YCF48-related protein [Alphaproteobacteria bacterium]
MQFLLGELQNPSLPRKENPPERKSRMIFSYRKTALSFALIAWMIAFTGVVSPQHTATANQTPFIRDNLYDVAIHKELVWIVGYYGTILNSQDRGLTWAKQQSGTTEALFRVVFRGANFGWACGSYGTLLHTEDGGATWQKQEVPVQEHLFGLDFIDQRHGVAVGSRGTILVTEDGGATWSNRSLGDDVTLNDVRFIDHQRGWLVGEFGRIYYSKNGGQSWVKQKSPIEVEFASGESRSLFRLLMRDSHTLWAFGMDGSILATQDGHTWKIASPTGTLAAGARRSHLFAAAALAGKGWAVGERGALVVSNLTKNEWIPVNLKAPPTTLNGIAFGNDHLGLIVGNRGLILRTDDGGQHWQKTLFYLVEATGNGVYSRR